MTGNEQRVLRYLTAKGPLTTREIAEGLRVTVDNVKHVIYSLKKNGKIEQSDTKTYLADKRTKTAMTVAVWKVN